MFFDLLKAGLFVNVCPFNARWISRMIDVETGIFCQDVRFNDVLYKSSEAHVLRYEFIEDIQNWRPLKELTENCRKPLVYSEVPGTDNWVPGNGSQNVLRDMDARHPILIDRLSFRNKAVFPMDVNSNEVLGFTDCQIFIVPGLEIWSVFSFWR